MYSKFFAAGLLALSGLASAFPQGGFNTTGGTNTTTSPSGNNAVTEALFCPALNGNVILSPTGVSSFILECNTKHFGVVIAVSYNSTIFAKRQTPVAPANIQDCLAACDTVTGCVGTAFDISARTCTLYASVGVAETADGIDFAVRVADEEPSTLPAGATATSTIFTTAVQTITSCAPTVTDCPLNAVVTEVIPVSSTEYICPTATVIPAAPIACSCAYSASTVTVYSVSGTTVVPVTTTVVAYPSPTGTADSTTTVAGTTPVTTAPTVAASVPATTAAVGTPAATTGAGTGTTETGSAGSAGSPTTSGLTSFTGGASNVQAGMGLAGIIAAAAIML